MLSCVSHMARVALFLLVAVVARRVQVDLNDNSDLDLDVANLINSSFGTNSNAEFDVKTHNRTVADGGPCTKKPVEPKSGCTVTMFHSKANTDWCACQVEMEKEKGKLNREMAAIPRTWNSKYRDANGNEVEVNTFEQGKLARNKQVQDDKDFKRTMAASRRGELADAIFRSFADQVNGLSEMWKENGVTVQKAMGQAMYVLLQVPKLTKAQFIATTQALRKVYRSMTDGDLNTMFKNLVANGHLGGPGVGRATVTPERRAYLNSLKPLPPIDPGPRFKIEHVGFGERRQEGPPCAGWSRTCSKDVPCCAGQAMYGTCTALVVGVRDRKEILVCQ